MFMLGAMIACSSPKKDLHQGIWQGKLIREDGKEIVFNFDWKDSALYIMNAGERLRVEDIRRESDSVFIRMPLFDSEFRTALQPDGRLGGWWIKHLADKDTRMAFEAIPDVKERFKPKQKFRKQVTGRWSTWFYGKDTSYAVGEFEQHEEYVQGTFLTPTGDYRYLQGIVDGDSLKLSAFDGSHVYLFNALILDLQTIQGTFYAGLNGKTNFICRKNDQAKLPPATQLSSMKDANALLDFTFPDMNGRTVSLKDFRGKAVIVQLGGSWCPNCMDETAYLSEWYKKNKARGVEILMLAYERYTETEKARKAVESFVKRFDVQYPVLLTGVTSSDPQKGEKTLPQLTGIKGFPTTIYVDKTGRVKTVHTGFNGPGTGEHYETYKREFNALMDGLLK